MLLQMEVSLCWYNRGSREALAKAIMLPDQLHLDLR